MNKLKELTKLHEKIKMEMLGVDWESRRELNYMLKQVEAEMVKCHSTLVQ